MSVIEIKENPVANMPTESNSNIVEINGKSNVLKILQRSNGYIKFHGSDTCIYLGYEPDSSTTEGHVNTNDLLYQVVEVLELLIILIIFFVIVSNLHN